MLVIGILLLLATASHGRLAEDLMNKEEAPAIPVREQIVPTPLPALPATPGHSATCFHADRIHCPRAPQSCARVAPNALLCCDVDNTRVKEGLSSDLISGNQEIQSLHVLNATLEELDVSQSTWRRLMSISFTDGNIKQIVGEFRKYSPAACLNISNNGIINITSRALVNLFNLTTLDMSGNKLTSMPRFKGRDKDFSLDINGNNEMLCKSILDALGFVGHLKFLNSNTTFCTSSKTFQWFNSTELVPIRQVESVHELKNDCAKLELGGTNCNCEPVRLDIVAGKLPAYSVRVDCSNRNLKKLPTKLPPNTIELNVSYNEITSLAALSDDPSYENVRQLYADHNLIQSIYELEGTKFIENFMHLSLKANKLKTLPTYILSDTFDRNWSPRHVFLANNELHCGCNTAKFLKTWLLSKTNNVPDYDQVLCENTKGRVIDLAEDKVCPQQHDWTDYIYYIITAEVLMLLGLVTKVSYDYWVFKSAGYLPWPASKMPKLPCDWLCE